MINAKKFYKTVLSDQRITSIVPTVLDAFPDAVETFPCIIFSDDNQMDKEFADNLPLADNIRVQVHIYTKALKGYKTTSEIGMVIADVMKENWFVCTGNTETPDVEDKVRHRVMYFTRDVYSL